MTQPSPIRVASRYRKASLEEALKSLLQQDFHRLWGAEGYAEKVNGDLLLLGTARTHSFDDFVDEVWGEVFEDSDYDELKAALRPIYSRLSKPKITLDKKQSGSSMWVTMYDHGHEIGHVSSKENPSLVRFLQQSRSPCESDLRKLLDQYGDAPLVDIWAASLLYPFQGQGLGKTMYEAVLDHYRKQGSCYAMPNHCVGGETSPDAMRVWKSLARKYPSEGECLWIS
jgi:GNAT superfamily N-acetyltransferase